MREIPWRLLAVDPGAERTGIAVFVDGKLEHSEILSNSPDSVYAWVLEQLGHLLFDQIIIEDYRLRPGKQVQQTGSRFSQVKAIGAIELLAQFSNAPIYLSSPQNMKLAAMHTGVKIVSHFPDNVAAELHGVWWLENFTNWRAEQGILGHA